MENELRRELEAGKSVSVKIKLEYPTGPGVRPAQFKVAAMVGDEPRFFSFRQ
jgi:hypothetical protein